MNLAEIRIQNFRSFKDETIPLDDYTCLVGPNGSGKSTVLTALNVFFRNNDSTVTDVVNLMKEDFHHWNINEPIRVTLTFDQLSKEAQTDLKHYYRQEKLVVFAEASWDENTQTAVVKQHGCRNVMKEFAPYFELDKSGALAGLLKVEFERLREKRPDIPSATTKDVRTAVLRAYEEAHPELCSPVEEPCNFYGFSRGKDKLDKYIQWVYVPAVKDASTEQEEGSKTALGQLLQRTVRTKIDFDDELAALEEKADAEYETILEGKKGALKDLELAIQKSLRDWTNPRAVFELEWQGDFAKVRPPIAKAKVGEDSFIGEIARLGHGMQRGFLVAILKELVSNEQKGGPKLLLGFEEPELYQHPPQAQHIQGVLERLAEPGNNSQIIVTTHSPYFVSSKGFENIRMFRKYGNKPHSLVKSTDYTKVKNRLTKAFGEETPSPTSLMATVGQILQTSQKELFFSPIVVLVEGQEDVAFIATHLNLTGEWKSFRKYGCHFVIASGKNNIPRLLAIAQEFDIPTFVICDSDIETSIEMLKKAENLPGDTQNKATKVKNQKGQLNKQVQLNKAIANLCASKIDDPLKCETIIGDNIVLWKDAIGTEVAASFKDEKWLETQRTVTEKYGFEQVNSKSKNGMVIAATLQELYDKGEQSSTLIILCGQMLQYAQKIGTRGKT